MIFNDDTEMGAFNFVIITHNNVFAKKKYMYFPELGSRVYNPKIINLKLKFLSI